MKYAVGTCLIKKDNPKTKILTNKKKLFFSFNPIIKMNNEIVLKIKEWCSTVGFPAVGYMRSPALIE